MILSVRGTSGSGKTHIAKRLLTSAGIYGDPVPHHIPRRKQPYFYIRPHLSGGRDLVILGHYESATGGVDTISGNDIPFELAREHFSKDRDVFMEGLLLSAEQHRTAKLHEDGIPVRLFYLNTTLEDCLASVQARRAARGNLTPLNPDTTASRHRAIRTHPDRFRAKGLHVTVGSRNEAVWWLQDSGHLPLDPADTRP